MPTVMSPESAARRRVIWTFLSQGVIGLALMLLVTWSQRGQTISILHHLGASAPILIVIFIAFATTLALLKFELTDLIFISLVMTSYMTMFPLLGAVMTSWIAVSVSIVTRLMAMRSIGPVRIGMADPPVEYVKTFGLFGTYGIPVVFAATLYERIHGELPLMHPTAMAALKIAICSVAMIATNLILMFRPARSYGYSVQKIAKLDLIDGSIYLVTLPYAIVTAFSFATIGWGAVLALAYTGIFARRSSIAASSPSPSWTSRRTSFHSSSMSGRTSFWRKTAFPSAKDSTPGWFSTISRCSSAASRTNRDTASRPFRIRSRPSPGWACR